MSFLTTLSSILRPSVLSFDSNPYKRRGWTKGWKELGGVYCGREVNKYESVDLTEDIV